MFKHSSVSGVITLVGIFVGCSLACSGTPATGTCTSNGVGGDAGPEPCGSGGASGIGGASTGESSAAQARVCIRKLGGPPQLTAGTNPYAVASGDLNGDGLPDLVASNTGGTTLSVMFAGAQGVYAGQTNLTVGSGPRGVAIGDVSGDGKADIIVATSGSGNLGVSILSGNGDGTFSAPFALAVPGGPGSVALGDFNGDRKLDIAVTNGGVGVNNVYVFLNQGSGQWSSPAAYAAGSGATSLAVGDVDADGNLDLVTASFSDNAVSVLLGSSSGVTAPLAVGSHPYTVALGHLNGDNNLDIAVINWGSNNVSVLLGGYADRGHRAIDDCPHGYQRRRHPRYRRVQLLDRQRECAPRVRQWRHESSNQVFDRCIPQISGSR